MTEGTVLYAVEDGVAHITLNRPDRLNSFNTQMHAELGEALNRLEADDSVRAVLITGAGRGFCAGQDLSDRAVNAGDEPVDLGQSVENFYNPLIRRLTGLDMPVVCAVNGVAAGAGANIAFACDIVLAARGAKFIQSFANVGLVPDSGGSWVLPRLVGQARALGMALTAEPIMAETAERWGLIWKVFDDDHLLEEARTLTAKLAKGPTQGLAAIKKAMRASWSNTLDEQLDLERDWMRTLGKTQDYREAVDAFLNKRQPVFRNR